MRQLLLVLGLLTAPLAYAGEAVFHVTHEATLAASAHAITIQQPASGSKKVTLQSANLYCENACTVTLEKDGTAASSTAGTVVTLDESRNDSATATVWVNSNVGSGTTIYTYVLSAGQQITIDLEDIVMVGDGTGNNVTLRTASTTGDIKRGIKWTEK